ncbi:MAG TPA: PKD domain-containing protein [Thermoanaerobaculia bacterium]|jgi:PKD repeat protein|nr:PKD domain-containing protein [Thermoanaerobaculia bacterium]
MLKHFKVYWPACVLLLLASAASATTIVLPTDDQLIRKSPVIVEGTVISSTPVLRDGGIWTETKLSVDRTLKGDASSELTIREVGGEIDGRITKVFGSPVYQPGERVMAFLTPTSRGDYQTIDLFVGKFSEERAANGRRFLVRDDAGGDVLLLDSSLQPIETKNIQRDATAFESYVTDRVAGRDGVKSYGVANPVLERDLKTSAMGARVIKPEFTLISEGTVYRWNAFDGGGSAKWFSYGTQPGYAGGGVNEIQTAMNAWNSYSAAKINYAYSGSTTAAPGGLSAPNGVNEVLFNDPKGEISGTFNPSTGGVVGQGGFNGVSGSANWTGPFDADASHTSQTYRALIITEGNLTIQDGVTPTAGISSTTLAEIVAHEFGHTLGFGHSTDSTALMYPSVTGLGPSLRADDQVAARWLYPNGSATPPPPPPSTTPAAPTGLVAAPNGSTASLQWNDVATNETGYRVYLASSNGGFSRLSPDLAAGTRAATISSLAAGTYRFYVAAFNSAGESAPSNTASATIGSSVTASFVVSPSAGVAGVTTFVCSDTSTGATSWSWNFGDGGTSTAQNPAHIYNTPGTYTVQLTANGQAFASHVVSVSSGIAADFVFSPSNPTTQTNITFSDRASGNVASWFWNFGDGSSSTSQNPVKRYTSGGNYPVTLTVSTSTGLQSTISHTVTVTTATPAAPPVSAAFAMSSSATVRSNVAFTDQSTGSPTSWQWSFGDGSSSNAQNPTHAYGTQGSYGVSLTVSNATSSSTASHVVTILPPTAYRSLVPAAAQTNGVGGSVWRTELTLFNGGSEPASGQFTFIPGGGAPVLTRSLFLGVNQSITFANALSDLFNLSNGAGAIAIEASSATTTPAIRITSRTFTTGTVGTYGQSVPNVSSDDLTSMLLLTGLESDANFRTNIGLVNRTALPVAAGLTLYDANGNVIATAAVTVPENNFQQSSLGSFFPAVNGRTFAALSMRVDAATPNAVSAYGSVIDNRTQDPVYVQAIPTPKGSELTIPAVGRAPGVNNTFWRSDITLFNPGLTTMTVGLRYLAAGQDNRGAASHSVTISPSRTVVIADVAQALGISSGTGALQVTWNAAAGPIVTSRTYITADNGGTYGQSIDPVAAFGNDSFVPGLRSDSSFRSNVGFVNGGDTQLTVTATLLSDSGAVLGTTQIGLSPRSQVQYAVGALFPAANNARAGTLTLLAHADGPANLFAYGSIVDNASGDPVFFGGR